jgi:hypothetical protein
MSEQVVYIMLASLMIALIPLVPKMLELRIAVLKWIRWNSMANLHVTHFGGLVTAVRIIMAAMAVTLIILAIV